MKKTTIRPDDGLTNICFVAAERFREHAIEFRKLIDAEPQPMLPTGAAALSLAEQFERQAEQAYTYAQLFQIADDVLVTHEEELLIETYAVNADGMIAERGEDVACWDVMVRFDGGDPLEEFEGLTETEANDTVAAMERKYPDALVTDCVGG